MPSVTAAPDITEGTVLESTAAAIRAIRKSLPQPGDTAFTEELWACYEELCEALCAPEPDADHVADLMACITRLGAQDDDVFRQTLVLTLAGVR